MAAALRGPHHCVGTATSVAEMIFRYLNSRCQASGGTLSMADIEAARAHVLASFPSHFSFFETTDQRCMEASGATAPALFARDSILPSLMLACGQKAAQPAFPNQLARFGEAWLTQFFGGIAHYIREHACPNADERLIKAYSEVAVKLGAKLTINDVLNENATKRILYECFAPLAAADSGDHLALELSDVVSHFIAKQRGIPKPDISKVTEQEMRHFLHWLPPQLQITLKQGRPALEAAPP